MAKRRMFSTDITESDAFADMPLSSQALYFHLGMNADDDGFVNNPKRIQRGIGASNDDLSLLVAKRFIIAFDSGVVVIKHWKINNSIRLDRKVDTKYIDEMGQLVVKESGAYTLACGNLNGQCVLAPEQGSEQGVLDLVDTCQPNDNQVTTKCPHSIGKDSIGKDKDTLSGKPDVSSASSEIVSYLNSSAGTKFKPTTKKTVTLIRARLREGFTVADFKAVIDKKVADWRGDPKMCRYLRPETLFGTKFEGYLNEREAVNQNARSFAKYR